MRTRPFLSGGLVSFAVVSSSIITAPAAAQQGGSGGWPQPPQANPQPQRVQPTPEPQPAEARASRDPLISPDPAGPVLDPWNRLKADAEQQLDLKITPSYTFLYQYATDAITDKQDLFQGRLDLGAEWTLYREGKNTGSIGFLLRSGENIGNSQQFALQPAVGDLLGIDSLQGGGEQHPANINLLYWRQSFFDNRLAIYVGKLHPNQHMDLSFVANDESNQFLTGAFDGTSSNPVEGAYTPGVAMEAQLTEQVYVNVIVVDALGKSYTGVNTIGEGKYFEAVEFGCQPQIEGWGKAKYRIAGWHTETANGEEGAGIQAGFDQEIGGGWVPFLRWGYGDPDVTAIKHIVAGGIANISPFGRRGDMWGLGIAYGIPSDDSFRHETLIETFYRLKLTDSLELSPDIEVLVPPADPNSEPLVAVFGLRLKAIF